MHVKMCKCHFSSCIGQPNALDLLHKLKEEHKFDVILTVESGGLFMM